MSVDESKCNGCGRCQVACAMGHRGPSPESGLAPQNGSAPENWPAPLLHIAIEPGGARISICRHCEQPPCVDACVAGAIRVDRERDAVLLDETRCVGCWSCVMECPFGAPRIYRGPQFRRPAGATSAARHNATGDGEVPENGTMSKCDGCQSLGEPLCARVCPTGALRAGGDGHSLASRRRRWRSGRVAFAGGEAESDPGSERASRVGGAVAEAGRHG